MTVTPSNEIREVLEQGIEYHQLGNLARAEACYRHVLEKYPGHTSALEYLGILCYQKGEYVRAEELLRQVIAADPERASLHVNIGAVYQQLGQHSKAYQHYLKASQLEPDNLSALLNLAALQVNLNELQAAKETLHRVLAIDATLAEAHLDLAKLYAHEKSWDQAIDHCQACLQLDPDSLEAGLALVDALEALDRVEEAIAQAQKLRERHPDQVQVLQSLGLLLSKVNQLDDALQILEQAVEIDPACASAYVNMGVVYGKKEQFDKEIDCYHKALQVRPDYARAYNNLGAAISRSLLREEGTDIAAEEQEIAAKDLQKDREKLDIYFRACDCFQIALALDPDYVEAHHNLGILYTNVRRIQQAGFHFKIALELDPDRAELHNSYGCYLLDIGQLKETLASFEKAVELEPGFAKAYNNLGRVYQLQQDEEKAQIYFQRALEADPEMAEAYCNIGAILLNRKKYEEALLHLEEAIQLNEKLADAHFYKGTVLSKQSLTQKAIDSYKVAIKLNPKFVNAYISMGGSYLEQCRLDKALECFRKARELAPLYPVADSNILMCMHYSDDFEPVSAFLEHQRWGYAYQSRFTQFWHPYSNDPEYSRPLRIGYLSGDFRMHSVHFFMEGIYQNHNREAYQIYCYSNVEQPDDVTYKIMGIATQWRNIAKMPDDKAAELIRKDRIDILVDLGGHTGGTRVHLLALRPAPIQVTYLGYPDTTGMSVVDYRITDNLADPVGVTDYLHAEKLVRMPHSFLCYWPSEVAPPVVDPPVLKNGYITFGCCNNPSKITPKVLELWAKVLKAIPNSKLHLKNHRYRDEATCNLLWERIGEHGIPKERVELEYERSRFMEHYAAYGDVDIALDPFPYNGTTTTCETLWMGVPVITLEGNAHVCRVGYSILTTVDLKGLIAHSEQDYIDIAKRLSEDVDLLTKLRRTMRDRLRASPLLNHKFFTLRLEAAYRQMWYQWLHNCKGSIQFWEPPFTYPLD